MTTFPFGITYRDNRGFTYAEKYFTLAADPPTAAAQAEAFYLAVGRITNATIQSGTGCLLLANSPAVRGGGGVYASGTVKAVIIWTDSLGNIHRWRIPAPVATCFQADGYTLDQSDTNTALLITAFTDNFICGKGGTVVSACLGGFRAIGKQRRHITVDARSPSAAALAQA